MKKAVLPSRRAANPQVPKTQTMPFEPHDWRLRLFLAGAINWGAIRLLTEAFWNSGLFIFPMVSAIVAPILLSVFLTKGLPEKRIVPIGYIQLITFIWLLLTYFLWNTNQLLVLGLVIGYTAYFYLVADVSPYFVGRNIRENAIDRLSLVADCSASTMQDILSTDDAVISCISIDPKPSTPKDRIIFHSERGSEHRIIVEVESIEDSKDKCRMNIVYFKRTRYTVEKSEYFAELVERDIPYLITLLSRRAKPIHLTKDDPSNASKLIEYVYEHNVNTIADRVGKLTSESLVKITLILASLVIPLYLWFGMNDERDALVTFSVIGVSLVLTSAQELSRRKGS